MVCKFEILSAAVHIVFELGTRLVLHVLNFVLFKMPSETSYRDLTFG